MSYADLRRRGNRHDKVGPDFSWHQNICSPRSHCAKPRGLQVNPEGSSLSCLPYHCSAKGRSSLWVMSWGFLVRTRAVTRPRRTPANRSPAYALQHFAILSSSSLISWVFDLSQQPRRTLDSPSAIPTSDYLRIANGYKGNGPANRLHWN